MFQKPANEKLPLKLRHQHTDKWRGVQTKEERYWQLESRFIGLIHTWTNSKAEEQRWKDKVNWRQSLQVPRQHINQEQGSKSKQKDIAN